MALIKFFKVASGVKELLYNIRSLTWWPVSQVCAAR